MWGPEWPAHPAPAAPRLQRLGQGVQLLLAVRRAVRVAEVQQALVVVLQEPVELGVLVLQPGKLVLVLRRPAFPPAGEGGQSPGQAGGRASGWG